MRQKVVRASGMHFFPLWEFVMQIGEETVTFRFPVNSHILSFASSGTSCLFQSVLYSGDNIKVLICIGKTMLDDLLLRRRLVKSAFTVLGQSLFHYRLSIDVLKLQI